LSGGCILWEKHNLIIGNGLMYRFCPLASGSKGNAIYVELDETKLLIDVGLSFKALRNRLGEIDVDIGDIDAILITHEHKDHVYGLERTTKKLQIPVFANSETAKFLLKNLQHKPRFYIFSTGEPFEYKDIEITPFSVQHDTLDPVAFILKKAKIKIGVCTDLGFVTTLTKIQLKECTCIYVEANHEPSMVYASSRPMFCKRRIMGRQGHLSNDACAQLLKEVDHADLQHIYLAHLSSECNNPDLALERVYEQIKRKVPISIAYQERVSHPWVLI